MKLVITIDDDIYEHAKVKSEDSNDEWDAMRAIANGTPLPKGHGRLIDESKIHTVYTHTETNINNDIKCIRTIITRTDAQTIIEADWEG